MSNGDDGDVPLVLLPLGDAAAVAVEAERVLAVEPGPGRAGDDDLADLLGVARPAGERCIVALTGGRRIVAGARALRRSVAPRALQDVPAVLEGLRADIGLVALWCDADAGRVVWLVLRL